MQEWYYTEAGQQQGPVTLEQLRELASNGNLQPDDMVWNSTMSDWTPAHEVSGIFSSQPVAAELAPTTEATVAAEPDALQEIAPGSDLIGIRACLSKSLQLTKQNFGSLFLVGLVYFIIMIVVGIFMGIVDAALGLGSSSTQMTPNGMQTVHHSSILYQIVVNLVSTFFTLGLIRIGLNVVDGQEFGASQLFSGGSIFIKAVIAQILFALMAIAAFIPMILATAAAPGSLALLGLTTLIGFVAIVYISLRFGFYIMAIVDRGLSPVEAFKYSSQITTRQRGSILLLWLASVLVIIAGALCLLIGLIFAIPVVMLSWVVAYRWMQYGSRVTG